MKAARKFVGVIDGKEVVFAKGDTISKKQAEELRLDLKPELVDAKKTT